MSEWVFADVDLLKEIETNGVYKFKYPNGYSFLYRELERLVNLGLIYEKDVGKGCWVFRTSEYEYTITDKGLDYLNDSESVFIDEVCTSYRHDFGILSDTEKDKLRFECKEWIRAIDSNDRL